MRHPETGDLAKWRRMEQALEAGLDPELTELLDRLRQEDAGLLQRPPRLYAIRVADPAASPEIHLRRTG